MMWFTLAALAVPPDKVAARIATGGSGEIDHLLLSYYDNLLIGRSKADNRLVVLEIDTWQTYMRTPCSVTSVAEVPYDEEDVSTIVVGCSDGTATSFTFDGSAASVEDRLTRDVDDDDDTFFWTLATNGGPISQMFWDFDQLDPFIYAYEGGDIDAMHVLAVDSGDVDADVSTGFPTVSLYDGFVDGVSDASGGAGYIVHGDSRLSTINFGTGVFSRALSTNALYNFSDIGPVIGVSDQVLSGVWAVDTNFDSLIRLDSTGTLSAGPYTTVDNPRAIVAGGTYADGYLLIAGDGLEVHTLTNGFPGDITSPYFANAVADINIQDAVANEEYAFGGGEAGKVAVITSKPWVSGATADPATGTPGDVITVEFTIDEASDWQLCFEGTRTTCGTELASGSVDGEETVTVDVEITESFIEGYNRIYVIADDGTDTGHARVDIEVDDIPTRPVLPAGAVGFGDEALTFSFAGISDADLAQYELYISDVPFTRASFDDPDFVPEDPDVTGGPTNPIVIAASGGQSISMTISPLVNDVTYYLSLRAIDEGGLESEMSNVVTGKPEKTYTASELADETGGGPCSTGGSAPGSWALLAGLVALFKRRRLAAVGALAISSTALADEEPKNRDSTPQYGNFELRYGGFLNIEDDAIKSVFGSGHNMLQVEFGPQITRFFEIDVEAGFYQELAHTVTATGAASSRRTMLTMYPLGLSVTGRVHIIDEQIIVPYGKYGVDFVYWTELTDNSSGGKTKVQGSKVGQHFALGAGLLLDIFAPARASLLEAYSGINDTYITFEFRRQIVDSRSHPWAKADDSGFTFTGNMITVGLKLDY